MKYGVNRKVLLITAGVVWIIAGVNILRIGIMTWLTDSQYWLFKIGEATVVFLLFFLFVFKRLYYKHTKRIGEKKKEKNCPFSFFWLYSVFQSPFSLPGFSFGFLFFLPSPLLWLSLTFAVWNGNPDSQILSLPAHSRIQ